MARWLGDTLASIPPVLAYLLVGVLATGESVFVGLVLPGELALLLGGFLAFRGQVSLAVMMAVAAAGAVGGYLLGYEIGRRYGPALRTSRIGRRIGPARWQRVEGALAARGARILLLGRLVGILRAVMPAAAGMTRMRYRTFATYAVVGGVVWGPGFVLLGYLAGTSYRKVATIAGPAGLVLLILLALISTVTAAARYAAAHQDRIRAVMVRRLDRPAMVRLRRRYRTQLSFAARRLSPGGALGLELTVGLAVIGVAGWAFGAVLEDVLHRDELATVDSPVAAWLVDHRTAWLTTVMRGITAAGTARVTVPLLIFAGLLMVRHAHRLSTAVMLIVVPAGTSVLVTGIKLLTTRTRPDIADLLTAAPGYAFPSGHSAHAAAVYGLLAYLAATRLRRWSHRVAVWTVAVLVTMLVGFSRLYLGAHWLTDVLGGYTLAATWTALVVTAVTTVRRGRAGAAATTGQATEVINHAHGTTRSAEHR
ncbi:bifunctional DedA family/phosphatase PAP2 family protein [Actinoplanes sp. NPDC020271]|uniref:bifunctional DedA family/phosphatase PAP2 family protein n=1 Tax=Actinoplanes sp. NPDC020271 TaxID=3363896 RepID=UPI0037B2FDB1